MRKESIWKSAKNVILSGLLAVLVGMAVPVWSQFDFPAMSGRSAGLAGCGTALDDVGSAGLNVAGYGLQRHGSVGVAARNTALLKELSYGDIALCLPLKKLGTFALAFDHFGAEAYHEQRASLAYAMPIVKRKVVIGARFDYLYSSTNDPHYEPLMQLSFAAGILARPTAKLTLGARTEGARLWNVGASYQLAEELMGTLEAEYQGHPRLRAGIEYAWQKTFYARAGVATNPGFYAFGIGYRCRHLAIDLAMQQQHMLGNTLQTSIIYLF